MGILKSIKFISWYMKRDFWIEVAKSTAILYRQVDQRSNLGNLEKLVLLAKMRYDPPPANSTFSADSVASLGYMRHRITSMGEPLGLLAACASFTVIESKVSQIGNDIALTLLEVLQESGFTEEQIFGREYSVEEFDSAVKRVNQRTTSTVIDAQAKRNVPEQQAVAAVRPSPQSTSKPQYPSWAHELAAVEIENLKVDRQLWDAVLAETKGDTDQAKSLYIPRRAETLIADEKKRNCGR